MEEKKYIILEIIPTAIKNGEIAQLSALKINGLTLEDRFDYRLEEEKINNYDIREMIKYDQEQFKYIDTTRKLLNRFKKWIADYDLLIIDNEYTRNYLNKIDNNKESIFKYLNMDFSDNIIDEVIEKYNIPLSNHIVDILYEAILFESGDKNGTSK